MAGAAGAASAIRGSSTVNVAPCPGVLATEMVPPWASTIAWQIASPRPVPPVSRPRAASALREAVKQRRQEGGVDALPRVRDLERDRDAIDGRTGSPTSTRFRHRVLRIFRTLLLSMSPGRTLRMSKLADVTNGSLSRLSNVVKRLEQRDLVRRAPDPTNGRYTNAFLTEAGWECVVQAATLRTREHGSAIRLRPALRRAGPSAPRRQRSDRGPHSLCHSVGDRVSHLTAIRGDLAVAELMERATHQKRTEVGPAAGWRIRLDCCHPAFASPLTCRLSTAVLAGHPTQRRGRNPYRLSHVLSA